MSNPFAGQVFWRGDAHYEKNRSLRGFPDTQAVTNTDLLELDCDILIPAANENQITGKNASRIKAKITAEENTSKSEAERRLRESSEEAAKVRAAITEEQRTSKAEAERRVREATEEANRRRHDAITEAQARLQDAVDAYN